jgi:hypothetical protein
VYLPFKLNPNIRDDQQKCEPEYAVSKNKKSRDENITAMNKSSRLYI